LIFDIIVVALDSMKDTFGKKSYKCKCGTLSEEFVWASELEGHSFECAKCGKVVGFEQLNVKKVAQSAAIRTPTKNR
jgi:hypothetical protein